MVAKDVWLKMPTAMPATSSVSVSESPLTGPGAGAPGPYRVRVGRFRTRDIAQRAAGTLEARLNEKLWVTRAR